MLDKLYNADWNLINNKKKENIVYCIVENCITLFC